MALIVPALATPREAWTERLAAERMPRLTQSRRPLLPASLPCR
jgi:hypothetical protein